MNDDIKAKIHNGEGLGCNSRLPLLNFGISTMDERFTFTTTLGQQPGDERCTRSAIQWLMQHGALYNIAIENRSDWEAKLDKSQYVFVVTGIIELGGKIYRTLEIKSDKSFELIQRLRSIGASAAVTMWSMVGDDIFPDAGGVIEADEGGTSNSDDCDCEPSPLDGQEFSDLTSQIGRALAHEHTRAALISFLETLGIQNTKTQTNPNMSEANVRQLRARARKEVGAGAPVRSGSDAEKAAAHALTMLGGKTDLKKQEAERKAAVAASRPALVNYLLTVCRDRGVSDETLALVNSPCGEGDSPSSRFDSDEMYQRWLKEAVIPWMQAQDESAKGRIWIKRVIGVLCKRTDWYARWLDEQPKPEVKLSPEDEQALLDQAAQAYLNYKPD
jgi:hypothetical protein